MTFLLSTVMDDDFLDLIDQAFLDGQIDGETMLLACYRGALASFDDQVSVDYCRIP